MAYSAVVLDLDGTLLTSEKQVSDRSKRVILRLHQQGMQIIFATARPPRAVKQFLPQELLEAGLFVYYNGALTICKQYGIESHESMAASDCAELIDFCLLHNPDVELGVEVRDEWFSLKEIDYTVRMNVKGNPVVRTLDELRRCEATKVLLTGAVPYEELHRNFGSKFNILHTDRGELIQISSLKASKEAAVSNLCGLLDISMDDVIAFGDDINDYGLFQQCGWPVAMENAIDELKAIAREVTASNDKDGVALILERYLLEQVPVNEE
ncbi:Cof-type HAD-IIB family hydrolase [Paenibacillus solisilvae]|uniref:Cof-type HAD-IIB family hydrolase n=1 Tax=Paenibacillus solisilvae TaxID=2486751 RepID=A0ABW0W2D2_9BACL